MDKTVDDISKASKHNSINSIIVDTKNKIVEIILNSFLCDLNVIFVISKNTFLLNCLLKMNVAKQRYAITSSILMLCELKFIICNRKIVYALNVFLHLSKFLILIFILTNFLHLNDLRRSRSRNNSRRNLFLYIIEQCRFLFRENYWS